MLKPKQAAEHGAKGWPSTNMKGVKESSLTLESGYCSLIRLEIVHSSKKHEWVRFEL